MVCDAYSFCNDIENKFDILINDAAVSPNRRFFAVVYVPGTMKIFRTSDAALLHTVSEVSINHWSGKMTRLESRSEGLSIDLQCRQ